MVLDPDLLSDVIWPIYYMNCAITLYIYPSLSLGVIVVNFEKKLKVISQVEEINFENHIKKSLVGSKHSLSSKVKRNGKK